jgi:hypothetical protein
LYRTDAYVSGSIAQAFSATEPMPPVADSNEPFTAPEVPVDAVTVTAFCATRTQVAPGLSWVQSDTVRDPAATFWIVLEKPTVLLAPGYFAAMSVRWTSAVAEIAPTPSTCTL